MLRNISFSFSKKTERQIVCCPWLMALVLLVKDRTEAKQKSQTQSELVKEACPLVAEVGEARLA